MRSIARAIVALISVLAAGSCSIAPEDAPWTPLSLEAPLGFATRMKALALDDGQACLEALASAPALSTRAAASDAGGASCPLANARVLERSSVSYGGALTTSCPLVAALYIWEREVLQPAAMRRFDARVVRIDQIGSFACRNVYNRQEGRVSEHARANALDIAGFRLEDGRRVSVARDWHGETDEARFLHEIAAGSCAVFSAVLTPAYNRAHADHLHLDMGPYRICARAPGTKTPRMPLVL